MSYGRSRVVRAGRSRGVRAAGEDAAVWGIPRAWHGVGGLGRVLGVLVWESLGLLGSGWNAGTKKDGVCASLF